MSNALHDYAKLFEKYAARNGGTGAILPGEDCLSLANEMRMDADVIEAENEKLREMVRDANKAAHMLCEAWEGSCDKEAEGMSVHAVCPIGDTNELCVFGKLYDRINELGIKVDA